MREAFSRLLFAQLTDAGAADSALAARLAAWAAVPGRQRRELSGELPPLRAILDAAAGVATESLAAESPDGSVSLLMDGFLLNGDELLADLPEAARAGARRSPAALLLALYQERGEAFLARTNGWFAVALHDRRRGRALLAGDRFGFYPLYACTTPLGRFAATDAHSLLRVLDLPVETDRDGLAGYLAFEGALEGRTLFAGIRRLGAAALWSAGAGDFAERSWFDFRSLVREALTEDPAEALARAEALFDRVMPRYTAAGRADVFSLTGGWDSRLMASFHDWRARPLPAHTYGMNPRSLDAVLARRLARRLGIPADFLRIDAGFFARFPALAREALYLSDGQGDATNAHILHVLDQVPAEHRFVLTGKYGSQTFRGIASHAFAFNQMGIFPLLAPGPREDLAARARGCLERARAAFGAGLREADRDLLFLLLEECRRVWGGNLAIERSHIWPLTPYVDNDVIDFMFATAPGLRRGSVLQKALVSRRRPDLAGVPTNRGETGRPGHPASRLEAAVFRARFLADLVANSRRFPPRLRLDRLPLARLGTTQYRTWFRGELAGTLKEVLLDPRSLGRGLFDRREVERAVTEHVTRRADRSNELRKLLSLEITQRLFMDGEALR
ncbi:MAG: hypothetical protein JW819_01925 [Candidatus Krumholzibacteriota bacterium]|nr:hypothetical protein [Candidatus Krumholzibacteriota bacterium]